MAYDPVTKIYTPEYTPNPDAYIKKLTNQGLSKAEAAASARYQAYADKYFAPDGPGANIDPTTGGLRTPVKTGPTQEELDAIAAANAKAAKEAAEALEDAAAALAAAAVAEASASLEIRVKALISESESALPPPPAPLKIVINFLNLTKRCC